MKNTRALRMLASLVAATLLAIGLPSVAFADTPRQQRNIATGRCLSSGNFPIMTVTCNGDSSQQWHLHIGTYGYQLINAYTGQCLATPYPNSSDVYPMACNSADRGQQWILWNYNGGRAIRNVQWGRCLTDQFIVTATTCPSTYFTNSQLWAPAW